jgi:hypothetical protein
MIALRLPLPPSTNALFFNRKKGAVGHNGKRLPGRGKTKAYKAWIENAGRYLMTQKPLPSIKGAFTLQVSLPSDVSIDADNLKAIPDVLKRYEIIEDDGPNFMRGFGSTNVKAPPGFDCLVVITPCEVEA